MPLVTKSIPNRIDVYFSARCLFTHINPLNYKHSEKSIFKYSGSFYGAGVTYNFKNKWGVNCDYTRHPHRNAYNKSFLQFGISYN